VNYGAFFSVLLTIPSDSLIVSFATKNKKRKNSPNQSSFFLSHTKRCKQVPPQDLSPNYYDLTHKQSLSNYYDKKKLTVMQANSYKNFIKISF